MKYEFFATTVKGMEELLLEELQGMGIVQAQVARSGVSFQGPLEAAYRACLQSRIANRILLPLRTFPAATPEQLYGGVRTIHWTDHLTENHTLAVDFSSSHSQIGHSHFGALKVKDAVVDQLRSLRGARPSVDPAQPDLRINVYVLKDQATVSLDLSGESLHRRGYREEGGAAALKENLAAAILMLAGWHKGEKEAFLDPMCGSGTLPIEAALMAYQVAPGLNRRYYGFLNWLGHVPVLWKRLLEEAQAQVVREPRRKLKIVGYDRDFRAVRLALGNLDKAGMHGKVHIEKRELKQCEAIGETGIFVVNPPYGARLGEEEEWIPLYGELGDLLKQKFKGWDGYIFTGSPLLSKSIGLKASRRFVLLNGPIECRLLRYSLY